MRRRRNRVATIGIFVAAAAGGVVFTETNTPGFESLLQANASGGNDSAGTRDQTVQGEPINYQYGTVQVEVVQSGGKIDAINLLQSDANAGREKAFPYLQQYAIEAQGSNFGNLSGATATSEAFKQALESAISKLN